MSTNQINSNEMSAAHRNFLAADMCIFVHDLEKHWAPEIKMDPRLLREYLFKAAMDGLFDNIVLQTGNTENGLHILYIDSDLYVHVLSKFLHRLWGDRGLRRKLAKENFNGNPLDFYELTARCLWGLRKEAVWKFCRARNVTPPSFWPFPKQPSPERRCTHRMVRCKRARTQAPRRIQRRRAPLLVAPPRTKFPCCAGPRVSGSRLLRAAPSRCTVSMPRPHRRLHAA